MTHEQYANLLLQKLKCHFSCSDTGYRAYLHNFFWSLFSDPSVRLTEKTTQNFINLMDREIDHAAKKSLYTLESLYNDDGFNGAWEDLEQSFNAIGITMTMSKDSDGPTAITFTLPSGENRVWNCRTCRSAIRVNSQLRVVEPYREQMRSYYCIDNIEAYDLPIGNVAGHGTSWTFDKSSGELTIGGSGSLAGTYLWSELGILSSIKTVIIGAGVTHLTKGCICSGGGRFVNDTALVFLHGSADEIRIDPDIDIYPDTPKQYTIYADNKTIRNFNFGVGVSITWRSLSQW